MEEKTIAPIQTYYNGYHFRSRLEARWAVFFDEIGVEYEYEPEGFKTSDGTCYLPDFKLYNVGGRNSYSDILWVEVKGVLTKEDLNKIKKFNNYHDSNGEWVIENPIFIVGDIPYVPTTDALCDYVCNKYYNDSWRSGSVDDYYYNLEYVDGDYFGGFFVRLQDGRVVLEDINYNGRDMRHWIYDEDKTVQSYARARQARFEHGETPQKKQKTLEQIQACNVDIMKALETAGRTNRKFPGLWCGDRTKYISSLDPDGDGADYALCCILCYYLGPDPIRLDQAFRYSRLLRPKWDEPLNPKSKFSYGSYVIKRAIDFCGDNCFDYRKEFK